MQTVLVSGLVLVGALGVLNLLLTLALVRRMRDLQDQLGAHTGGGLPQPLLLKSGQVVGDFSVLTRDGTPLRRAELTGLTLVGFLSPGCDPCTEQLPRLAAYAAETTDRTVAVVLAGPSDDVGDYPPLPAVIDVVRETPDGPLCTAFGVQGYPAFLLIDQDGTILAADLEVPAPRPTADLR